MRIWYRYPDHLAFRNDLTVGRSVEHRCRDTYMYSKKWANPDSPGAGSQRQQYADYGRAQNHRIEVRRHYNAQYDETAA